MGPSPRRELLKQPDQHQRRSEITTDGALHKTAPLNRSIWGPLLDRVVVRRVSHREGLSQAVAFHAAGNLIRFTQAG